MENWVKAKSDNIILSSRIRLARNIKKQPFPNRLKDEEGRKIVNDIEEVFCDFKDSKSMNQKFKNIHLWDSKSLLNKSYLEKHLISNKLIDNSNKSAFITNEDETISIMINEEDHIRMQCITAGLNIDDVYNQCNKIDDFLEEKVDYAFNDKLGYLTACPTNLGTGIRASVMIHLPSLTMNNEMNRILNALSQVGMTIRGLYGEGSKAYGNIYQISNQVTLGIKEEDLLENLKGIVNEIINQENLSRDQLLKKYKYETEDRIFRAKALLKSARLIDAREALKLLSDVRMGVEMGILKDMDIPTINSLLVDIQPATIQCLNDEKMNLKKINIKRAEIIRNRLK